MSPGDEVASQLFAVTDGGRVRVIFASPVVGFSLEPEQARAIAFTLLELAKLADANRKPEGPCHGR